MGRREGKGREVRNGWKRSCQYTVWNTKVACKVSSVVHACCVLQNAFATVGEAACCSAKGERMKLVAPQCTVQRSVVECHPRQRS